MKLGITYPLNRRDLRSHIERRDGISNNGHITTVRCRFLRVITRPLSFDLVSTNPSIKRWIRDNTSRRERERERELPRRRESLVVDRLLREVFRRFCLRTGYAWAIYKRTYTELARSLVTAISCAINRAPGEDLCSKALQYIYPPGRVHV